MEIPNLVGTPTIYGNGKSSVVIVDNFQSVRGGRTLNVVNYDLDIIPTGTAIIFETATEEYKPMPVNGTNSIATLGTPTAGTGYTNGIYSNMALTGGTGTGATANIVVANGLVTTVTLVKKGTGYKATDSLTANLAPVGSGFAVVVATISVYGSYQLLPSGHTYAGVLINEITKKLPFAGIMVRGTINPKAAPFNFASIASAFKTAMPLIDQRAD